MKFSSEQLNFFKFSVIVLDEFPDALRQVFVSMWDNQVAPTPGFSKWDDSNLVRNMFLKKEGGRTKYVPTNKSYMEWDCTALFEATLFAQSFAMPDGRGGFATLNELYVKPRRLSRGTTFYSSVISSSGNQAETCALALDQLRLLRNSLCHQTSTQKIDKATFDHYIQLAKDAFGALGQNSSRIDDIGKLSETDFPTARLHQLEEELRTEKFKQIEDNLDQIELQLKDVRWHVQGVNSGVTDVKIRVEDVGSDVKDVKIGVTDVEAKVEDVRSSVEDVKTEVAGVEAKVEDVGSDVKVVKTGVADVKTKVDDVGSDVKDVKAEVIDVKTKVEDVGSDVKRLESGFTDVRVKVEKVESEVRDVRSDVMEVKANFQDLRQARQKESSRGPLLPDSCIPDKIPHFVGRQEECKAILDHLTAGCTRLVDICGPPGFGKTSVAINVAHQLREKKIPTYFISLRGMKSKDEIVSRLLSIFAGVKQAPHISPCHLLLQCLQHFQSPSVLILDNADDLLESRDTKIKEEVLTFTDEILAQCSSIKLLFTTRESLDYLSHKYSIHVERVGVLDEISSASLVRSIVNDISEDHCSSILKECEQVPLAMRFMCSIMNEENISVNELLKQLRNSTLVEVLDNECFPDDARLKTIINTSFQRLSSKERDVFVSLVVFPGNFRIEEARAVLGLETASEITIKAILRSLERKSLINSNDHFGSFTVHSLLRSFVDQMKTTDSEIKTVFDEAQLRSYDHYITIFWKANGNFLTGHSNDACKAFVSQREAIVLSFLNGTKAEKLYPKVVEVLSNAELFLYAVLPDEEVLFNRLYQAALEEAKKRQRKDDECKLFAAKSFGCLVWFYLKNQNVAQLMQGYFVDADCSAKHLCYLGVYKLLCGNLEEGISALERSADRLASGSDERVLKVLACHVLAVYYRKKGKKENASHFKAVRKHESNFFPTLCSLFLKNTSSDARYVAEQDAFFFVVMAELLPSLYKALGDQTETELSIITRSLVRMQKVLLVLFKEGCLRVRVLETCCNALHSLGCYDEAVKGFVVLTGQLEKVFGNHDDTARNYHFLGSVQYQLKDYKTAFHSFQKALAIRRQLLQDNADTTHDIIREYISLLKSCLTVFKNVDASTAARFCGKFKEACEELEGVLKSQKLEGAKFLVDIGGIYHTFADYYYTKNDYKEALLLLQRSITIREEHLGDHLDTAASLNNEGSVYFEMTRYTEARESYRRALDLMKRLGLEDHEKTADFYHNLGMLHFELAEYNEACEAHFQALRLRCKHLGNHPLVALSYNEIGCIHYKIGQYEEAKKQFQNAANLRKTLLGNHVGTATSFQNLSDACLKLENYSDALNACVQALNIRLEISPEHVDTATSLHFLGSINVKMSNFKAAVRYFRRASALRSKLLGDHHVDTALSYHCLGEAQYNLSDFDGAVESLLTTFTLRDEILGFHFDTAATSELLGRAYRALGVHDLASLHIRRALEIREHCTNSAFNDPSDPLLGQY